MTASERAILDERNPLITRSALELRWTRLVHERLETTGSGDVPDAVTQPTHQPQALVLSIAVLADDHAIFEAWLERPGGRRTVLSRQPLPCRITSEGSMHHLDCTHEGRRIVALTLGAGGEVAYARSDLLAAAGFAGGSYDPPSARRLDARHDAASA